MSSLSFSDAESHSWQVRRRRSGSQSTRQRKPGRGRARGRRRRRRSRHDRGERSVRSRSRSRSSSPRKPLRPSERRSDNSLRHPSKPCHALSDAQRRHDNVLRHGPTSGWQIKNGRASLVLDEGKLRTGRLAASHQPGTHHHKRKGARSQVLACFRCCRCPDDELRTQHENHRDHMRDQLKNQQRELAELRARLNRDGHDFRTRGRTSSSYLRPRPENTSASRVVRRVRVATSDEVLVGGRRQVISPSRHRSLSSARAERPRSLDDLPLQLLPTDDFQLRNLSPHSPRHRALPKRAVEAAGRLRGVAHVQYAHDVSNGEHELQNTRNLASSRTPDSLLRDQTGALPRHRHLHPHQPRECPSQVEQVGKDEYALTSHERQALKLQRTLREQSIERELSNRSGGSPHEASHLRSTAV